MAVALPALGAILPAILLLDRRPARQLADAAVLTATAVWLVLVLVGEQADAGLLHSDGLTAAAGVGTGLLAVSRRVRYPAGAVMTVLTAALAAVADVTDIAVVVGVLAAVAAAGSIMWPSMLAAPALALALRGLGGQDETALAIGLAATAAVLAAAAFWSRLRTPRLAPLAVGTAAAAVLAPGPAALLAAGTVLAVVVGRRVALLALLPGVVALASVITEPVVAAALAVTAILVLHHAEDTEWTWTVARTAAGAVALWLVLAPATWAWAGAVALDAYVDGVPVAVAAAARGDGGGNGPAGRLQRSPWPDATHDGRNAARAVRPGPTPARAGASSGAGAAGCSCSGCCWSRASPASATCSAGSSCRPNRSRRRRRSSARPTSPPGCNEPNAIAPPPRASRTGSTSRSTRSRRCMINAVLAAEDKDFFHHGGVDPFGIVRAAWADVRNKGVRQGGSTITQQYVKNVYLTKRAHLSRKIKEAVLAVKVEQEFSKREILERYLNTIYFGRGAYGVGAAARSYFGKDVDAAHAARGRVPRRAHPRARRRPTPNATRTSPPPAARRVLDAMVREKFITVEDARPRRRSAVDRAAETGGPAARSSKASARSIGSDVRHRVLRRLRPPPAAGQRLHRRRDLRAAASQVYTTIDLGLQQAAFDSVTSTLDREGDPNAALVAIDEQRLRAGDDGRPRLRHRAR